MSATAIRQLTQGIGNLELHDQIEREVQLVEEELYRLVGSDVMLVEQVGRFTLEAGGKRLRPAFVSLAARATGRPFDENRARRVGACMEMVHMATLVHDDVIDHAATRRGRPTAAAEFGNTAAILGGDVLLAKAMLSMARDGDVHLMRSVSEAVVDMATGEVRELELRGEFNLSEEDHLDVLRRKTAAFIEACCEVGVVIAGGSETARHSLKKYGHHIGLAFQIVDDLLDYQGDQAKTGKPVATDFREGQATLPLIYLREQLSEAESMIAKQGFGNGASDDDVRMIADWMQTRGAFEKARRTAVEHVHLALDALKPMPPSPSLELMVAVAEYVLNRQS